MRMGLFGCLLALVITAPLPGLAEQPTGQSTLENSVQSNETAVASANTDDVPTVGRPAGTLVRPKDGVQHPALDKAWAVYEEAIAKASKVLRGVLAKQFDSATAKADLDAAEKWQGLLGQFDNHGTLPQEAETQSAVTAAKASFSKALEPLQNVYESIQDAYTRDKKIAEAKALRDEWKELAGGAAERAAFLPKEGFYEFTQHDGARFIVEVKGDSVAITSWINRGGEQWWVEMPELTQLTQRGGELHADRLAFNTEQLRWNAKTGTAGRDWVDGAKKGTVKCRVKVFAHPLLGEWRYVTQGGHVADVEFVTDGTVLWHNRESDIRATKFWSQKDESAVLVSDRRGEQGEKGWHIVHLPMVRNEAVCDDWFAGKRTARLRRSP